MRYNAAAASEVFPVAARLFCFVGVQPRIVRAGRLRRSR
jgi:hypothetical protein